MKRIGLLTAMLAAGAAHAQDGLKIGGHVDAQYQWEKETVNTFAIPDASLWVTKTLGGGEATLDLSVYGQKTAGGQGFTVGMSPASQAFVNWKYENGFWWRLGQWHSIYGYESVHSYDVRFSSQGLLYAAVPVSHTGLLLGYDFSELLGLSVLAANPADTNYGGNTGNYDFGVKVSTKFDALRASVGGLFDKQGGSNSFLLDVVVGYGIDKLTLDFDFLFRKGGALGVGLIAGYGMTDMIDAGARIEWTKDLGAAGKVLGLTVGPQFKLSDAFTAKLDYTLTKPEVSTGHGIALAAVHKF